MQNSNNVRLIVALIKEYGIEQEVVKLIIRKREDRLVFLEDCIKDLKVPETQKR
jgi:hypothetical protein